MRDFISNIPDWVACASGVVLVVSIMWLERDRRK